MTSCCWYNGSRYSFAQLNLRPSNLQLMPWNFQIQYSYLLNVTRQKLPHLFFLHKFVFLIFFEWAYKSLISTFILRNHVKFDIIIALLFSRYQIYRESINTLLCFIQSQRQTKSSRLFNTTINNISASMMWQSVLPVDITVVCGENHWIMQVIVLHNYGWANEWLLFNTKCSIFQLHHAKNKLPVN
jgi:hypothetical protein